MARTPTKHNSSLDSLNLSWTSPKSPAQNASPLIKRLIVILQKLTADYAAWQVIHRKGISVCRSIETVKCKGLEKEKQFPADLEPHCTELETLLKTLEEIVESTQVSVKQISSLSKLDKDGTIVLRSWNIKKSEKFAEKVLRAFEEEFRIKKLVKENIAFVLNQADLVYMSCVWEYQSFVNNSDIFMEFSFLEAELK